MPTPTIPAGNLFMNATLYTGNGVSGRTITNGAPGQSFQPDLVWTKARSVGYDGLITDVVRGSGKSLTPSSTAAEVTNNINGYVSAFNSDGFTLTQGSSSIVSVNETSTTYVGWQWKAGGTAVSNTVGSIASQVSANTTSGFSVVTYTGNGTAGATIGHGLGVAPKMVILKIRDSAQDWIVGSVGMTSWAYAMRLNTTGAQNNTYNYWNSTTPSSTVVTLGDTGGVNSNGNTYVAYCWAPIAGFSAFGSYTGNGSTDGPFIYTGFRPRFIIRKSSTLAYGWYMNDTSENQYNVIKDFLTANTSNAQTLNDTNYAIDIVSNGFKVRSSHITQNNSGDTYVYAAFAENPFKYANAR
jgi:hypothetical protein